MQVQDCNLLMLLLTGAVALFFIVAWWNGALAGHIAAIFAGRAAGLNSMRETQEKTKRTERIRFGLLAEDNRLTFSAPAPEEAPVAPVPTAPASPAPKAKAAVPVPAPAVVPPKRSSFITTPPPPEPVVKRPRNPRARAAPLPLYKRLIKAIKDQ